MAGLGAPPPTTDDAKVTFKAADEARPSVEVEIIGVACCFLLRNLLALEEQAELFEYIRQKDTTPSDQPRAMVPAPKTLQLGADGGATLNFARGDASVVNRMVEKAVEVLTAHRLNVVGSCDVCHYTRLSMATIRYEAPGGHFPPHVDHCDGSSVFLASLGCTANFMVQTPAMAPQRVHFKLHSGDLLVFDASTKAAVLHSVVSIDEASPRDIMETSSQLLLGSQFPALQKHRYGVQCRVHF